MSKKSKKLIESELAYEVLAKLDSILPGASLKMENHVLDGLKPIVRKFFKTISKKERTAIESKLVGEAVKPPQSAAKKTKKVSKTIVAKATKAPSKKRAIKAKRKN
ncbi:MAG: hypothetical protein ACKOYC_06475 [Bacteroidota bacterium]